MSKLDELGGMKEAKYWVDQNKDDYEDSSIDFCEALIERVEELERQLKSARELAERVEHHMSKYPEYVLSEIGVGVILKKAREFLKLLEGK